MPNINDYYAFRNVGGADGGGGSPNGCLLWVLVGFAFLCLIGKLSG